MKLQLNQEGNLFKNLNIHLGEVKCLKKVKEMLKYLKLDHNQMEQEFINFNLSKNDTKIMIYIYLKIIIILIKACDTLRAIKLIFLI